jgi:dienelactone hydrolase
MESLAGYRGPAEFLERIRGRATIEEAVLAVGLLDVCENILQSAARSRPLPNELASVVVYSQSCWGHQRTWFASVKGPRQDVCAFIRKLGMMTTIGLSSLLLFLALASPAQSADFLEENGFFRVTIGGRSFRLEGLTVKRADANGRLPIALIAHGKPSNLQSMQDDHPKNYIGVARDLASRGWLAVVAMRRGFGQSDGPMPSPMTCRSTSFVGRFSADADDLQATLDFIVQRPDADPTRIIAIGASAGGPAITALSARHPMNLRGVINISGGLHMDSCPKDEALVQAFKEFGANSRVPTLWMYAKNDIFFGPEVVGRMHDAFLDGGADVKFVMFDPIGQDGHTLFSTGAGRNKWLPEMDGFLRFHDLPTWKKQDVDVLLKRLNSVERDRTFVESFLAAPFEKALAHVSSINFLSGAWGSRTIGEARKYALDDCGKERPQHQCVIVMENNSWVGGTVPVNLDAKSPDAQNPPAAQSPAVSQNIRAASIPPRTFAATQDCPTAQSGKLGFVVERGEQQKSDVFHADDGIVRTVMRYNGTMLLDTTEHEGLFQLDRLDNGRKTKFEPQNDLKKLFPLKIGINVGAKFISEGNGQQGTLSVEMVVRGAEVLYIGPCKYNVLKIERSESRSTEPPRFVNTDYYSPELKLILAKEYRENNGSTHMIKYDRIYPLKR